MAHNTQVLFCAMAYAAHMCACIFAYINKMTRHARTHAHKHARTHTRAHAGAHACKHAHKHAHALTHTCTHACTHASMPALRRWVLAFHFVLR